jgi:hypothetical protein
MDLKEVLKEGGLAVIAIVAAVYICGWQHYLVLFHALAIDIHVFLPVHVAVGAGIEPVTTLLVMPGLVAALLAVAAAKGEKATGSSRSSLKTLLRLVAIISGGFVPLFVRWTSSAGGGQLSLKRSEWVVLSFLGASIGGSLFTLVFHFGLRESRFRYHWYALSVILVFWACIDYAHVRGRSAANATAREFVRIVLSDDKLEREYGGSLFAPLMEIDDDMVLVQFDSKGGNQQSVGPHRLSDGHVVFVRRSLIQVVEYVK